MPPDEAENEDEGSKVKRPRKSTGNPVGRPRKRHPDQPRRPQNAFFLFCQEQRPRVQREFRRQSGGKDIGKKELTRMLAEKWNEMPSEHKQVRINDWGLDELTFPEALGDSWLERSELTLGYLLFIISITVFNFAKESAIFRVTKCSNPPEVSSQMNCTCRSTVTGVTRTGPSPWYCRCCPDSFTCAQRSSRPQSF